jgi:hypothetical protein
VSDFEVTGAEDFYRLSKALKAAGRTDLRKELNKSLRAAAKPLIPQTRAAARQMLPKRGGLADAVARVPQRVQVRTGQATAGVRIVVGKNRSAARASNRGLIRHPVFGNRQAWVEQKVPSGWFDDTLRRSGREVLPALEQAMQDVAEKVVRGG